MNILMSVWPPFSDMILDGSKPYVFRKKILEGMEERDPLEEDITVYLYDLKRKGGSGNVIGEAKITGCYGLHYTDELKFDQELIGERMVFLEQMYMDWCRRKRIQPNKNQGWLKSKNFKRYQGEIGFTMTCNYALKFADPVRYKTYKKLSDFVGTTGTVILQAPKNMRVCSLNIS